MTALASLASLASLVFLASSIPDCICAEASINESIYANINESLKDPSVLRAFR
jgi:hypothetical protein